MVDAKNASKCTDLHVTIQNFPVAMPPNPHVGEGLQCPSPNPTLGTPALQVSGASFGAAIDTPNVC